MLIEADRVRVWPTRSLMIRSQNTLFCLCKSCQVSYLPHSSEAYDPGSAFKAGPQFQPGVFMEVIQAEFGFRSTVEGLMAGIEDHQPDLAAGEGKFLGQEFQFQL